MSINSCTRIVPAVKHFLNSQTTRVFQINNRSSQILCKKLSVSFYSTDVKSNTKTIYYGILTPQIKAVKIFSLSSSVVGILAQPFLYNEIARTGNLPVIVAAYSCIGFFTIVTPILLHFITKKYVTHLEYKEDSNKYIARTVNFFCLSKETEFTPEDVHVPDVPGMFTTFHAKNKPLFIDPRLFEQPEHYAKIMGYDKPLDFKLYQTQNPDAKKD